MDSGIVVRNRDDWRMRRKELIHILSREEYGFTPAAPAEVRAETLSSERAFAGKATHSRIKLSFNTPSGEFSFPFDLIVPENAVSAPAFIYLSFRPELPDQYLPVEEILDHGFAIASIDYQEVTTDTAAIDGLAAMYPIDPQTGWGTIGMWAFAASRVFDYIETLPAIDPARVCVVGHSRLGKTALWCAAQDERFAMVVSNDSGCSGAAISRGKVGETIRDITGRFPYWFCGNYRNWVDREFEAPFDQHMLLALIAPRRLYVSSATEDEWADPASEFASAQTAAEAWRFLRAPGLIAPDGMPQPETSLHNGSVAYHLRTGSHFLSRADWLQFMAYREKHCI